MIESIMILSFKRLCITYMDGNKWFYIINDDNNKVGHRKIGPAVIQDNCFWWYKNGLFWRPYFA